MGVSKFAGVVSLLLTLFTANAVEIDRNGYVLYCPCMGRFGNQADHFLGALAFARGLNRTLVLPPWVEYHPREEKSVQVPFDKYFQVEPLQEYVRVMTMEDFMTNLAPEIWPPGKRTVYCYMIRNAVVDTDDQGCNAKDGNPFGSFWDTFDIDFDKSEFFGPLYFNTDDPGVDDNWNKRFPVPEHLVMAFSGAPASFPAKKEHIALMKYVKWSKYIEDQVDTFLKSDLPEGPIVGAHMRNGIDWKRACEHTQTQRNMFASAQCLGYGLEHGVLTEELCFPTEEIILKQIKDTVQNIKAKAVFVAADDDHMISKIKKYLNDKVTVVRRKPADPHVDLAILGRADHYIGNCVSTFSAFATRQRKVNGDKPTSFWAFPKKSAEIHEEL